MNRGFTLIELMIVVAIIVLVAAFAIPNMLRSKMNANEASAVSAMRLINTGEIGFKVADLRDDNNDGESDFGSLEQLGNPPGEDSEPFIDTHLATGFKHGYAFTVTVISGGGGLEAGFACRAAPILPGESGVRRFYVDENGVLRFTNDGTDATPDSSVVQ